MPLSITRYNAKKEQPNKLITFITALPDSPPQSLEMLNCVAAIVYPIMKAHSLSVTSLEEYHYNRSFWGINYSAGENIKLVLRGPDGRYLGFRQVLSVMIHEISHNKQMNHSKAFWDVRNGFMKEMQALHARGYTGEGLYSRGFELATSQIVESIPINEKDMPEELCGGTYRRRRRTRMVRRRKRKFEGEGTKAGLDLEKRKALEGKVNKRAPRVANSDRGRELRMRAALARLQSDSNQAEEEEVEEEYFDDQRMDDVTNIEEKKWLKDEMDGFMGGIIKKESSQVVIDLTSDND
ncbi:WLM domain-containing protein [Lipomyces arxii]|uniref:WLM domain-containing protein n=1 Tax=Lipomyces arxii TaxID=56418 RepID=UPI0034CEFEA5